jgi:hypothetical protein
MKQTYERDDPLRSGDLVVITADVEERGAIGRVEITPGRQTVGVNLGCLHIRLDPTGVRHLRAGEKVLEV